MIYSARLQNQIKAEESEEILAASGVPKKIRFNKKKQRFCAPLRSEVSELHWSHPGFSQLQEFSTWLAGKNWPEFEVLNARAANLIHQVTRQKMQFVAQSTELLNDALHYEARIYQRGQIATRSESWHDLFNACMWLQFPSLKSAINARYANDLALAPLYPQTGGRTPAQQAITHFDEGGAVVLIRDPKLLNNWDQHDWPHLFCIASDAWRGLNPMIEFALFGHASFEHLLDPAQSVVAKCLVVLDQTASMQDAVARAADAINSNQCLNNPQELRPLPLLGIPGWYQENDRENFVRTGECFRPLRAGKMYSPPLTINNSTE